jgi:hypothetical protein
MLFSSRTPPAPRLEPVAASAIGDWARCSVRYKLEHVDGRRPDDPRAVAALRADGTAFHDRRDRDLRRTAHTQRLATVLLYVGAGGLALMLLLGMASCSAAGLSEAGSWAGALSAGLVMLALALFRLAAFARDRASIPRGLRLVSSDMGPNRTRTLRDPRHGLVGRPDWVFRRRVGLASRLVVAELKSRPAPRRPLDGHVLQTAAGIMLLVANHGRRASRTGHLIYADRSFPVTLDDSLRAEVLHAADQIRALRAGAAPVRNHSSRRRCETCPFASQCPLSLAA